MKDNLKTYLPGTEVDFLGKDSPPKYYSPISGSKYVTNRYKHRAKVPNIGMPKEPRRLNFNGFVALGVRAVENDINSGIPGPGQYNINSNLSVSQDTRFKNTTQIGFGKAQRFPGNA